MKQGDTAEIFELYSNDGSKVSLESFRGNKNVVLCFYPKNRIFGCPSNKVHKMAKSITSAYPEIKSTDSILFAISCDTIENQKEFVDKHQLPYAHLSDTTKETCKKYTGLNFVGLPRRSTFVIDKNGIVRKIFENITVEEHGEEIVSFLKDLQ